MGRDIAWYQIKVNEEHEEEKCCFGWEFEPEPDDRYIDYIEKMKKDDVTTPNAPHLATRPNSEGVGSTPTFHYSNVGRQEMRKYFEEKDWCQKCQSFKDALFSSNWKVNDTSIRHSYSNPIWMSDWCIRRLLSGSSRTPFCRRFSSIKILH